MLDKILILYFRSSLIWRSIKCVNIMLRLGLQMIIWSRFFFHSQYSNLNILFKGYDLSVYGNFFPLINRRTPYVKDDLRQTPYVKVDVDIDGFKINNTFKCEYKFWEYIQKDSDLLCLLGLFLFLLLMPHLSPVNKWVTLADIQTHSNHTPLWYICHLQFLKSKNLPK